MSSSSRSSFPMSPAQWGVYLGRSRDFYRTLKNQGLPVPVAIIVGGKERIRRIITMEDHQEWMGTMRRLSAEFEASKGGREHG